MMVHVSWERATGAFLSSTAEAMAMMGCILIDLGWGLED